MEQNTLFHDRYQLKKLLGRGQFSEVWLAIDNSTKVEVALKIYAPGTGMDDDGAQMLAHEFALVVNAIHENLLRPIFFDVCDRKPYLVLPYCREGSCSKMIGKMDEDGAWKFIHDVASGLAFLHSYKPDPIIHQDIKPDNIMIGPSGSFMITDFGVSTHSRSLLRKSVGMNYASAGTTAYMGPERFSKDNSPIKASDIYSLGATVFELLTGVAPFDDHGGLLQAQGAEIPDVKGNFSNELKYTVKSCLHFNPWDRPTAETLAQWAETRIPDMKSPVSHSKKNKPQWVIPSAIATGAAVLVLVGGLLLSNTGDNNTAKQQYDKVVASCEKMIQMEGHDATKVNQQLAIIKEMDSIHKGETGYDNYERLVLLKNSADSIASVMKNKASKHTK